MTSGVTCPEASTCAFYRVVSDDLLLRTRFFGQRHYCTGGDFADCARFKSAAHDGSMPADLLPNGDTARFGAEKVARELKVLVIDDSPVFCKLMAGVIAARIENAAIESSFSAEAALAMALAGGFDLVVTDYNMPGLNGTQLIDALRRDERTFETPVIVVTMEVDDDARKTALSYGRVRWVMKSPDTAPIADAIRELVVEGRV